MTLKKLVASAVPISTKESTKYAENKWEGYKINNPFLARWYVG